MSKFGTTTIEIKKNLEKQQKKLPWSIFAGYKLKLKIK